MDKINGLDFKRMLVSGAAAIEASRQAINELNVFPVPDGDTGVNMSLSISAAVADLQKSDIPEIGRAAETAAGGLLRGARGNSGVILSLLFRGFAKAIKNYDEIGGVEFALALTSGVEAAYRAVMKPAEGTILTVTRVAAAHATEVAATNSAVISVIEEALAAAEAALVETVNQNPVLKKAGVIDAGGKGFCVILDGMLAALQGREFVAAAVTEGVTRDKADFSEYREEDINFTYCTEFIITRTNMKKDPIKLRALLGAMGDSLVFVDDEAIIKVHVHTDNPGKALEEALAYGSLFTVKIENMREQHSEQVIKDTASAKSSEKKAPVFAAPEKHYGFVSVCAGEGLKAMFMELGVDGFVEGGQTMNPSTEDILAAINATPAEVVFVLPNNKNIIMAAEQTIGMTEKTVVVLPSKTIPQGVSALLAFDLSIETSDNRENMISAMANVQTGSVTYAARESSFDGHDIREGDHLALVDSGLLATNASLDAVLLRLAEEFNKKSPSYITVFYGEGVQESDALITAAVFEKNCPSAEVVLLYGGQPVYYYLVSAE